MLKTVKNDKYIEYTTSEVILINDKNEEIYLNGLKSDTLKKEVDTLEIKGGIENNTLTTIDKTVTYTFEAEDQLSNETLNIAKWKGAIGETSSTATILLTQFPTNKTVKSDNKQDSPKLTIELDNEPSNADDLVLLYKGEALQSSDYSLTGKEVTITKEGVTAGETIYVSSYSYVSGEGIKYYDVGSTSSNTAGTIFKAIIRKPIYDLEDNIVYWRQTFCPKVQLDKNVEQTGNTEKGEQPSTHKFTVLKSDDYDYTMRIINIPEK